MCLKERGEANEAHSALALAQPHSGRAARWWMCVNGLMCLILPEIYLFWFVSQRAMFTSLYWCCRIFTLPQYSRVEYGRGSLVYTRQFCPWHLFILFYANFIFPFTSDKYNLFIKLRKRNFKKRRIHTRMLRAMDTMVEWSGRRGYGRWLRIFGLSLVPKLSPVASTPIRTVLGAIALSTTRVHDILRHRSPRSSATWGCNDFWLFRCWFSFYTKTVCWLIFCKASCRKEKSDDVAVRIEMGTRLKRATSSCRCDDIIKQ